MRIKNMALEFTTESAVGEAELVIHLDIDGCGALLKAMQAALETGRGDLTAQLGDDAGTMSGGPKAFRKVIVAFAHPLRPESAPSFN
jgi:hypothetical protein